jgi:hypothetical protein
MKKNWGIIIVVSSSIGLLSNIIDALFFESGNPFVNLLLLLKYFTILSNLIVLIYFVMVLKGKNCAFFNGLFGGVVINITITFIMYGLFLSRIYHPTGFLAVANICNHYISPILVISYLIYFRKAFHFTFDDAKWWFVFPFGYLLFLLIHGVITTDFIYPFLNPGDVGVLGVIGFILLLFFLFGSMSFLLVKIISKK